MEELGEYRIVRLLGEGGMGKVYEATERLSGRHVALKVLRPELARSEPVRRLFENEMSILAGLDHPNVVRCLSCAEAGGELMMALELLPGRTLREVLREEGTIEWTRALGIAEQIARALTAAHEHEPPIVHRDLKPENVMVLEDGSVKVTDFGVAKLVAALGNESTHSAGTLAYMSPEQIDAGPVDGRSDLYALGVVLYELLAGRPPFHSNSPRELLNLACTKPPPPLPEEVRSVLPRGVAKLLLELLEKSPDARPSSAADVLAALEPFAPGSAEAAPRSPRRPSTTRPSVELPRHHRAERTLGDDTIAMLERARLPRDVSLRTAVLVIAALSALSGVFTYALTARGGGAPPSSVTRGGP
jgi:eukaryotic-like serine/threonine-protein kinase